MAFWSSQHLERELNRLVGHTDKSKVDCNAVTMRVGGEIYITPGLEQAAPNSHTKQVLQPGEPIAIPPGQFAFLLTEETVTIPTSVMGFISIKATSKLKGLVNVSGFHVDPGWTGPLIFAVFNAGPATIHLQRGMDLFLLWIADLDEASKKRKTTHGPIGIPPSMINNITGVVDSVYALEKRMKGELKTLSDEMIGIKEHQSRILVYFAIAAVFGGALVGAIVKGVGDRFFPPTAAASITPLQSTSVSPPVIPAPITSPPRAAVAPAGSSTSAAKKTN